MVEAINQASQNEQLTPQNQNELEEFKAREEQKVLEAEETPLPQGLAAEAEESK